MSDYAAIQQTLTELRIELTDRQKAFNTASARQGELNRRLGTLYAEQSLDGTDHTKRIEQTKKELGDLEPVLLAWPAVKVELDRRLTVAQQAFQRANVEQQLAHYSAMGDVEAELRSAFAAQLISFIETTAKLKNLIDQRNQMYTQITQELQQSRFGLSSPVRSNDTIPTFVPGWIWAANVGGLEEARRALSPYLLGN